MRTEGHTCRSVQESISAWNYVVRFQFHLEKEKFRLECEMLFESGMRVWFNVQDMLIGRLPHIQSVCKNSHYLIATLLAYRFRDRCSRLLYEGKSPFQTLNS